MAAFDDALNRLLHGTAEERADAAETIGNLAADGELPTPDVIAALRRTLDDPDARVLHRVVWTVGQHPALTHDRELRERIDQLARDERKKRDPDRILLSEMHALPPLHPRTTTGAPMSAVSLGSRDTIFISYSHDEPVWLDRLLTALKPVQSADPALRVFTDRDIKPGMRWRDAIDAALARSRVGVLLVSQNSLASEFIMKTELPVLLAAAQQQQLILLPVAVTACSYKHTPLKDIQFVNDPSTPLDSLSTSKRNRALAGIVEVIKEAFYRLGPVTPSTP